MHEDTQSFANRCHEMARILTLVHRTEVAADGMTQDGDFGAPAQAVRFIAVRADPCDAAIAAMAVRRVVAVDTAIEIHLIAQGSENRERQDRIHAAVAGLSNPTP